MVVTGLVVGAVELGTLKGVKTLGAEDGAVDGPLSEWDVAVAMMRNNMQQ